MRWDQPERGPVPPFDFIMRVNAGPNVRQGEEDTLVVVVGTGRTRLGSLLARLFAAFDLEHTYRFVKNTLGGNARTANTRASRTLDVARRGGLYPTATGPRTSQRQAPALGEASSSFATEPGEGLQGISSTACTDRYSSASTEISQTGSRMFQRHPETTKKSLSGGQESSVTESEGFNRKLRSTIETSMA